MSQQVFPKLHTVRPALGSVYSMRHRGLGGGPILSDTQTLALGAAGIIVAGGIVYAIARAMKPGRRRRRR